MKLPRLSLGLVVKSISATILLKAFFVVYKDAQIENIKTEKVVKIYIADKSKENPNLGPA